MPTSDSSNPCTPSTPQAVQTDALSQLSSLSSTLSSLAQSFQVPRSLTFQPTATSANPKLAYTSNNAPFHAYDERLTRLLTELDGVDSGGDPEIRAQRKRLVQEVEKELERLDALRRREWERQQAERAMGEGGHAPEPVAAGQRPLPTPPRPRSSSRGSSRPHRPDPNQHYHGGKEEKERAGGARRERSVERLDTAGATGGRFGRGTGGPPEVDQGGGSRAGSRPYSRPRRESERDTRSDKNPFWVGLPSRFG